MLRDHPRPRFLRMADTRGQLHPNIPALAKQVNTVIHAGNIGHPDILVQPARSGSSCVLLTTANHRWHLQPFQFPLAGWKTCTGALFGRQTDQID